MSLSERGGARGATPITVALLLTDVEGSTRLWETDAIAMGVALARHDDIGAAAVATAGGRLIRPRGEGDSLFAVFDDPAGAVSAAIALQRAFLREPWPEPVDIRVRMAVHCGLAEQRDDQLYGTEVNRCARLRQLARPGEVLVSDAAVRASSDRLPDGASLLDLGSHRLKDVARPERIHRVVHPDLPADFPPIAAPSHPNNLPLQVTSFIGRDREANDLAELVRNRPLVTLHGPGGVGKTRLAVETADDLIDDFPDGVWFVDLSALTDTASVPLAVAAVMGVRDQPGRSATATVVDHLRDARVLLLLDNCEHVRSGVVALVAELLAAAANLRVLATSRENLGVYGEFVYALRPMLVPAAVSSLAALMEVPAARLLVERVREVRTRYEPADADAPVIAAVCRRLDGMPLAMELAAARASSLSLAQIEERLDDRFRLLRGGGAPARPARQQTLEALVDWSYSLLDADEQLVLRRLSVFSGPFDLGAAEQVAGVAPVDERDVLDILDRLVRRSLVVAVPEDPLPYRQLDTIRAYAHGELVEAAEFEAAASRHAAYHLVLAEQHQYADAAGVARLRAGIDNLRSALQRCIDAGEEEMALRLCAALLPVWTGEGRLREARLWLSRALALSDRADPLRVRALCNAAWLAMALHENDAAQDESSRALTLSQRCDDEATRARAHHAVARSAFFRGDFATARTHLVANLDAARAAGNQYLVSDALTLQGLLTGHVDGDWGAALDNLRQAGDIVRRLGDAVGEVAAIFHVAVAEECSGDVAAALQTYRITVELGEATGYHEFLYCAQCALARHAASRRDDAIAAVHLDLALASLAAVDGLNAHRALETGACLAMARDDAAAALRLLGAAEGTSEDVTEGPSAVCTAVVAHARSALGAARAEESLAAGRDLAAAAALDEVRALLAGVAP